MVGVAQQSKGCGTCRRRRVKCDETKPACMRCKQARIACEGYQRWPVFIVRTPSGYVKRKPLDEIKVPAPTSHALINSPSAEAMPYISWFWETHGLYSSNKSDGLSSSYWLYHFMYCAEPLFHQSLLAVSLTAFGMQFKRPETAIAGRKMYISSLKSVRDCLFLTESVEREELPATVCAMVLYELLNSTTDSSTGWLAHLNGLYSLVSRRGPHRHCCPGSRAVLEHCRHLVLIQNLASRKASTFCLPTWLSQPWNGAVKDTRQLVIDCGLRLASLYEQCDSALYHHVQPEAMIEILESCITLYDNAQRLYSEQASLDLMAKSNILPMPGSSLHTSSDVGKLTLTITILTIQLGVCISAYQLVNRLSSLPVHTAEVLSQGTQNTIRNARNLGNMAEVLARQIFAVIQTCSSECIGGLDSIIIVYALNLASQRLTPAYQATANYQGLLQLFDARASRFRPLLCSS